MKKQSLKKTGIMLTAAVVLACFLGACGPEPGKEGTAAADQGAAMFGQGPTEGSAGNTGAAAVADDPGAAEDDRQGAGEAGPGDTSAEAGPGGAGQAQSGESAIPKTIERMKDEELGLLQDYLNEESSYGFLLSSYKKPQEIDLNQVFYSGAGFPQEELKDRERELLLERIPQEELRTPVVKVTQDQIEELLGKKAGITSEESDYSFEEMDDWAHIGRYDAWYALRGDTNRQYVTCTDGWKQGELYVVHYTLSAEKAEAAESAAAATAATAEVSSTAASTAATAESAAAGKSAADISAAASTAATAENAAADTDDASAESSTAGQAEDFYRPVYEAQLRETEEGWRFCSNTMWVQKDLIEAQSYRAELSSAGEVFFAPLQPDSQADPRADVTFALVKDHALLECLSPMEEGNVRQDRIFTGVDAVDFTDYNADGCTDILTVCTYTRIGEDGKKGDSVREARVYTGQEDAIPYLDEKKTAEVNRNVEILNITNVTKYLAGKSDGKARKYNSWKEAFADHVRDLEEDEYTGFALINLNDDATPELVQVGATDAKGATIVVYRNGRLEETWLNRRDFQYLEYENLLYSASGVENLHYDTIYSIVGGRLGVSVQGYYGNSRFAEIQYDENGKESYDYYWDGGEVSENGYRDGITFVFDLSRAKTCDGNTLMTAAELTEELK